MNERELQLPKRRIETDGGGEGNGRSECVCVCGVSPGMWTTQHEQMEGEGGGGGKKGRCIQSPTTIRVINSSCTEEMHRRPLPSAMGTDTTSTKISWWQGAEGD